MGVRRADLRGEAARARRHGLGALPRRRGLRGEPQPRRRAPRQADRDDRDLVRRGRQVRRAARSTAAASPRLADEKPQIAAPRDRYVYYPDTQSVPFFAAPARPQPAAQHHRGRRDPQGGAEGVLLAQGTAAGRLHALPQGPPAALRLQLGGPGAAARRVATDARSAPGRHELRFEFEPTGTARPRQRQRDARAARSSTSTASSSATARSPYTTPFAFNPGGADLRRRPRARRSRPTTTAPFRFTGTIHTVTVDLSGELISDPEAELRMHMARQ